MNVTGDTITFSSCRNDALGSGFGESSRRPTVVGSRETLVPCKDKKAVAAHFLSKDLLFFFLLFYCIHYGCAIVVTTLVQCFVVFCTYIGWQLAHIFSRQCAPPLGGCI